MSQEAVVKAPKKNQAAKMCPLTWSLVLILLVCAMCLSLMPTASAEPSSLFFRQPKWTNLPPSGGSLVSGRGNFRPGFYGRDAGSFMSEPSFGFSKRSTHQDGQWPYNS